MEYELQKNRGEVRGEQRWIRELAGSDQRLDISLTNDFAFKTTFRNKKALKGLLSALLDIKVNEIQELEFPDTTLHAEFPEEKEGVLDVKVLLNGKKKINIEIQVLPFSFWEERSLYYTAKYFVEGFRKGEQYKELNTTIHISILSFTLKENPGLYHIYELRERENHRLYSDKISLRVLQLKEIANATEEEKESDVYQWARMISTKDWEVLKTMAEKNEYMREAVAEIEKINTEEDLRYLYLLREKRIRDEVSIRDFEREEGKRQGHEDGHKQGLQQGQKQGIEQGIEQGARIKLISLIRKKLAKGTLPAEIAEDLEEAVGYVQLVCSAITKHSDWNDHKIDQEIGQG